MIRSFIAQKASNGINTKYIFAILLLLASSNLFGQERANSPSVDFNSKGIVFTSADSSSQVAMRFRIQSTMAFATKSDDDLQIESSDMSIRRLRLRFGGHLYDPRLTFKLQFGFSRSDLDYSDTDFPNIIEDAIVCWNFAKNLQIGVGQTKLPGNRQAVISSGDQQFADRSIVHSKFNLDRDFGVQGFYSNNIGNVFMNLRGAISTGDGRYAPKMAGSNFAYTGRFEILPLGKFTAGGDYFESDLMRETSPKISAGISFSTNKKSSRTRGQVGSELYAPRDMDILLADMIFKYSGFSAYTEFGQRTAKDAITSDGSGNKEYVYIGKGYIGQIAYLFHNNIELGGRIAVVEPDEELAGLKGADWNRNITGVMSYYLQEHRAKIQFELTHNSTESLLTKIETNNWIGKVNLELGI